MLSCNPGSSESLEDMKLDLIKAKYAHQKLKNHDINPYKQANNNHLGKSKTNVVKSQKEIYAPKFSQSPSLTSKMKQLKTEHDVDCKDIVKRYGEDSDEEDIDDEMEGDISKMNDYLDYILSRKRISINDNGTETLNLTSVGENIPSKTEYPLIEAYQRTGLDYNPQNMPSTDILAQWRLRRKVSEAQNSVKAEHQRHDLHIQSLKSQITNGSQSESAHPCLFLSNNRIAAVSDKVIETVNGHSDEVPVCDNSYLSAVVDTRKTIKTFQTSDVSCQCQLNKQTKLNDNKTSRCHQKPKKSPLKQKLQNNIAIMTCPNDMNIARPIDGCTQTDNNDNDPIPHVSHVNFHRSTEWDNKSACLDYIDRAIEKTLQSQLFERNYSPAMSTVTSINESQHIDVISQNNFQNFSAEDNCREIANIDANCEELPWNEYYQIDSDNEFQFDEVLIDLRKRRQGNLQKLRNLSTKIQNCKKIHVATIGTC